MHKLKKQEEFVTFHVPQSCRRTVPQTSSTHKVGFVSPASLPPSNQSSLQVLEGPYSAFSLNSLTVVNEETQDQTATLFGDIKIQDLGGESKEAIKIAECRYIADGVEMSECPSSD